MKVTTTNDWACLRFYVDGKLIHFPKEYISKVCFLNGEERDVLYITERSQYYDHGQFNPTRVEFFSPVIMLEFHGKKVPVRLDGLEDIESVEWSTNVDPQR